MFVGNFPSRFLRDGIPRQQITDTAFDHLLNTRFVFGIRDRLLRDIEAAFAGFVIRIIAVRKRCVLRRNINQSSQRRERHRMPVMPAKRTRHNQLWFFGIIRADSVFIDAPCFRVYA